MGRHRSLHFDLPVGVNRKGSRLYYGKAWIPLGRDDDPLWLKRYAELHGSAIGRVESPTFQDAIMAYRLSDHYRLELAPKTRHEYARQLKILSRAFGRMPLSTIEPQHVAGIKRHMKAKHSATRLKALFSVVFNHARENGLTAAPNPAAGIRGVKSHRDVYVDDRQLASVLRHSDRILRDFLELAYRTGADASVVLRLSLHDVRDGALHVQRTKNGSKVAITVEGPLAAILERLRARPTASVFLVADDRGQPVQLQAMRRRFWAARTLAGATWQIRDLRAKAGSDVGTIEEARALLSHASEVTTAGYRRRKVGQRAKPVMREIEEDK